MSAERSEAVAGLRRSLAEAAQQIDAVLAAAERVAEEVEREARAEAERYFAARRLEADRLVERRVAKLEAVSASLTAQLQMLAEDEQAIREAAEPAPEAPASTEARREPEIRLVRPAAAAPAGAPSGSEPKDGLRERAVVRATQLAITGAERERIVTTLREEMGIGDAEAVADEVLGA